MNARPAMSKYIPSIVVGFVVALAVSFGLSFLFSGLGADAGYMPTLAGAFLGIFTAYIMANLVGTKLGKTATPEQKQAALDLRPQVPDQALLIVYREGFVGKAVGLALALDDQYVAQLKSPRFTALSVAPGGHQLSMAFSGLAGNQNKPTLEGSSPPPARQSCFGPRCRWA